MTNVNNVIKSLAFFKDKAEAEAKIKAKAEAEAEAEAEEKVKAETKASAIGNLIQKLKDTYITTLISDNIPGTINAENLAKNAGAVLSVIEKIPTVTRGRKEIVSKLLALASDKPWDEETAKKMTALGEVIEQLGKNNHTFTDTHFNILTNNLDKLKDDATITNFKNVIRLMREKQIPIINRGQPFIKDKHRNLSKLLNNIEKIETIETLLKAHTGTEISQKYFDMIVSAQNIQKEILPTIEKCINFMHEKNIPITKVKYDLNNLITGLDENQAKGIKAIFDYFESNKPKFTKLRFKQIIDNKAHFKDTDKNQEILNCIKTLDGKVPLTKNGHIPRLLNCSTDELKSLNGILAGMGKNITSSRLNILLADKASLLTGKKYDKDKITELSTCISSISSTVPLTQNKNLSKLMKKSTAELKGINALLKLSGTVTDKVTEDRFKVILNNSEKLLEAAPGDESPKVLNQDKIDSISECIETMNQRKIPLTNNDLQNLMQMSNEQLQGLNKIWEKMIARSSPDTDFKIVLNQLSTDKNKNYYEDLAKVIDLMGTRNLAYTTKVPFRKDNVKMVLGLNAANLKEFKQKLEENSTSTDKSKNATTNYRQQLIDLHKTPQDEKDSENTPATQSPGAQ